MAITKIVFRNFVMSGSYYRLGQVKFYTFPYAIFSSGATTYNTLNIFETASIRVDAVGTYSVSYTPMYAFSSTESNANGWLSQSASCSLTVTFKTPLTSLYQISFINWQSSGGSSSFTVDIYNENNIIAKTYDVTNLALDTSVKTLLTPEFIDTYPTEIQLATTPAISTAGRYSITGITVVDSTVDTTVLLTEAMSDGGSIGSKKLWIGTINKQATNIEVI